MWRRAILTPKTCQTYLFHARCTSPSTALTSSCHFFSWMQLHSRATCHGHGLKQREKSHELFKHLGYNHRIASFPLDFKRARYIRWDMHCIVFHCIKVLRSTSKNTLKQICLDRRRRFELKQDHALGPETFRNKFCWKHFRREVGKMHWHRCANPVRPTHATTLESTKQRENAHANMLALAGESLGKEILEGHMF